MSSPNSQNAWRSEARARFERLWLLNPEQFNPLRNCMERERIERTWSLAVEFLPLKNKLVADLACGAGVMTQRLKEAGARVHALDIASIPLKILQEKVPQVDQTFQQCLPHTTLEDDAYDMVFADEVIAFIPPQQLRLFMSELSRLIKPDGYVICSTALDLNTQDPLARFESLTETESKFTNGSAAIIACTYACAISSVLQAAMHALMQTLNIDNKSYKSAQGFSQKWLRWNSESSLDIILEGRSTCLKSHRPSF